MLPNSSRCSITTLSFCQASSTPRLRTSSTLVTNDVVVVVPGTTLVCEIRASCVSSSNSESRTLPSTNLRSIASSSRAPVPAAGWDWD